MPLLQKAMNIKECCKFKEDKKKKNSLDMHNVAKNSLDKSCAFFLVTPIYDLLRTTWILDSRCSYDR